MLKKISSLGSVLDKAQQKAIQGGIGEDSISSGNSYCTCKGPTVYSSRFVRSCTTCSIICMDENFICSGW